MDRAFFTGSGQAAIDAAYFDYKVERLACHTEDLLGLTPDQAQVLPRLGRLWPAISTGGC